MIRIVGSSLLTFSCLCIIQQVAIADGISLDICKGDVSYRQGPGQPIVRDYCSRRNPHLTSTTTLTLKPKVIKNGNKTTTEAAIVLIKCTKGNSGRKHTVKDQEVIGALPGCSNINTDKNPEDDLLIGGFNLTVPFVISPKLGNLAEQPIILRWNAVKNATSYEVKLYSLEPQPKWSYEINEPLSKKDWTKQLCLGEKSETQKVCLQEGKYDFIELDLRKIPSANPFPILDVSSVYQIVIVAKGSTLKNVSSIADRVTIKSGKPRNLSFQRRDELEARRILGNLTDFSSDIAKIQYLTQNKYYSEALNLLRNPKSAEDYYWLGKVYSMIGLIHWAEGAYRKAIALNPQSNLKALIQEAIGEIQILNRLGQRADPRSRQEGINHLNQALLFYNQPQNQRVWEAARITKILNAIEGLEKLEQAQE